MNPPNATTIAKMLRKSGLATNTVGLHVTQEPDATLITLARRSPTTAEEHLRLIEYTLLSGHYSYGVSRSRPTDGPGFTDAKIRVHAREDWFTAAPGPDSPALEIHHTAPGRARVTLLDPSLPGPAVGHVVQDPSVHRRYILREHTTGRVLAAATSIATAADRLVRWHRLSGPVRVDTIRRYGK